MVRRPIRVAGKADIATGSTVHDQLTTPSDAGALPSSVRTDAGSRVPTTRHGPLVSGAGSSGLAMHSVTP